MKAMQLVKGSQSDFGRPNMRVQRTRSSPSALREPLTRHPLGSPMRRPALIALALLLSIARVNGVTPTPTPGVVMPVLVKSVEPKLPKGAQATPMILEARITEQG